MSVFHTHQWGETRRTFAPPSDRARDKKMEGPADIVERMVKRENFGVTTVELVCMKCGELMVTEIAGDARHKHCE